MFCSECRQTPPFPICVSIGYAFTPLRLETHFLGKITWNWYREGFRVQKGLRATSLEGASLSPLVGTPGGLTLLARCPSDQIVEGLNLMLAVFRNKLELAPPCFS